MWQQLVISLMPYILDILVDYIKSSSTQYDDKVLDVVKVGCGYLASQPNNDVSIEDAKKLDTKRMFSVFPYEDDEGDY